MLDRTNKSLLRGITDKFMSAKGLGIRPKQLKALIATLKLMESNGISERGFKEVKGEKIMFDMGSWFGVDGKCGTTCCIGGTAEMLVDDNRLFEDVRVSEEPEALYNLFFSYVGDITVERAAKQSRNYLETGLCNSLWGLDEGIQNGMGLQLK